MPSEQQQLPLGKNNNNNFVNNEGYSCNTENETDYLQQAFAQVDSVANGSNGEGGNMARELQDFDINCSLYNRATLATIEDEDLEGEEEEEGDETSRSTKNLICPKSKTFSDFLSALVNKHERGLIDEETAQRHSRAYVSKIFENSFAEQNDEDYGSSPQSSGSSLSISAIPDIYGPLDDLHVSIGSLGNSKVLLKNGHDSGFNSNKLSTDVDFNRKFPALYFDRTLSETDLRSMKKFGRNASNGGSEGSVAMFDDYDGDQILLLDTTAPSHVRSLGILPSD